MAIIHRTTLRPGKLELLARWLPGQPWYRGGPEPELAKAGGFRIDDPAGAVGIEFMLVTDTSGECPVTYLAPMTYRAAPFDGAGQGLIGTTEHGVASRNPVEPGLDAGCRGESGHGDQRSVRDGRLGTAERSADPRDARDRSLAGTLTSAEPRRRETQERSCLCCD